MNYANVMFNESCREKLIAGVNLCANAVQVTYGPNGQNAIILAPNGVMVTKDGYHTALEVNDSDPYITMGIQLIQDTCRLTAKTVGDGSSSSAILTRDLVNQFHGCSNPIQLSRNLKKWSEDVIEKLDKRKFVADGVEDLEKVATISANNDNKIGKIVAEAFSKVGKDGVVTIEESDEVIDHIDYSEGFRIDRGYTSPYFVNTEKNTCELENAFVHISETKITEITEVARIADKCMKNKQSLLLIAPDFDSEIIIGLRNNLELLKSCTIISPGHKALRDEWIKDLKALLGESMICRKVTITKNHTTFVGCNSDKNEIDSRIELIRSKLNGGELSESDLQVFKKRLANFTSGIATISVGGYSSIEMKERYDRIEDAVCATQAALTDGILPGGGVTLREIAEGYEDLSDDVMTLNTDYENQFYGVLRRFSEYLNTEMYKSSDMIEQGVIEPFLVEKTVIENAVATASLILTANVAIVSKNIY